MQVRSVFSVFDSDGGGDLSAEEFERAMEAVGIQASKEEVRHMMKQVDVNGSGRITFDECAGQPRTRAREPARMHGHY